MARPTRPSPCSRWRPSPGGSLYKTIQLRGGGATVAAMMGGQLATGAPATAKEKTLLNVVEEMGHRLGRGSAAGLT